jgi:hypothetical protein
MPDHAHTTASVYQLLITLEGIRPPIRRRVLVPGSATLTELHRVIQAAMGWQDYHLWRFEIGSVEYGEGLDDGVGGPVARAGRSRLDAVVGLRAAFRYEYDFGDAWEHRVKVERTLSAEPGQVYAVCVLAERACPPEDCGGVWGYAELLEVLADRRHPERAERLEWLGGGFDPEAVDLGAINRRLARLAPLTGRSRARRRAFEPPREERAEPDASGVTSHEAGLLPGDVWATSRTPSSASPPSDRARASTT